MDPVLALGVAGMIFIVIGWAVSITALPPLRLSVLYFMGSLLLTLYAIMIRDPIFTVLNAAAALLALANILRTLKVRRKD
ncbi:hypothetical protein PYJP_09380 [Pyrofollis japonicus]|uniref:hypothetical protein n=1 Tax=Pyrofollis japonicus TaxID=3060460 RepID=UPI00295C0C1F|nr:hypothetical protein [Pyrofollis japonicus]BEP17586.1 hypothetical protein PYJP_09380 [Pyrofollis japonicus]